MEYDQINFRNKARQEYRQKYIQALQNEDTDTLLEISDILNNDLAWTFDELHLKPGYVDSLIKNKELKLGRKIDYEEYKKNNQQVRELIEKDFENFNRIESSVVRGGIELANLDELTPEELENYAERFEVYRNTSGFGAGSRDFLEQAKSVSTGILMDVGTGGLIKRLGMSMFGKSMPLATLRKKLAALTPGKKMAIVSGGISGLSDAEMQKVEILLNLREEFDPTQLATATTIGAVLPKGMEKTAGIAVGTVQRGILHPFQVMQRGMTKFAPGKAETAAAKGWFQNLQDKIAAGDYQYNRGLSNFKLGLGKSKQLIDDWLDTKYSSFDYQKLTAESAVELGEKINKSNLIRDDKTKDLVNWTMAKLKGIQDDGTVVADQYRISPKQAILDLKKILRNAQQKAGTESDAKSIRGLYEDASTIQRNSIKDLNNPKLLKDFDDVQKTWGEIKKFEDTKFGRQITGALKEDDRSDVLFNNLTNAATSRNTLKALSEYRVLLRKIEKKTGNVGLVKQFMNDVQDGIGENLLANNGTKLRQLLGDPDGLRLLNRLFPDEKKFFAAMSSFADKLGKKGDGVIYTMSLARIAALTGSKLGADDLTQTGLVLGSMTYLTNLAEKSWFQKAMIRAINRKGQRLDTFTQRKLAQMGYTDPQIRQIQDILNSLPTTITAIGAAKDEGNKEKFMQKFKSKKNINQLQQ